MRVVIHIGVHKTGTTALQSFVGRNAEQLNRLGILYFTEEPWPLNHSPLAMALRKDGHEYSTTIASNLFDKLSREAINASCHTILISTEMFCEGIIDFEALKSLVGKHDIEIIAYLRRPDEIILSAYNEVVRSSKTRWQAKPTESPFAYDPTYRDILYQWIDARIGKITFAPYDQGQWKVNNLFIDFLEMLGIDDPSGFDFSADLSKANRSLPTILTEILRLSNCIGIDNVSHESLVVNFYRLWDEHPDWFPLVDALDLEQRKNLCRQLEVHLDKYRPHFRPGFNEGFLLSSAIQ